jgi:hypothetical protein
VKFLVQWDDEQVPRAHNLALFEALASAEKTLHANPGKHGGPGIRSGQHAAFFARHLGRDRSLQPAARSPGSVPDRRASPHWPGLAERVQAGRSAPARGRRQRRMLPNAALAFKQALSDPVNVS